MRLRPGLALLWRDATSVQVGTDTRWASVLTDLTPAATRALHAAGPGADLAAVTECLERAGVAEPERRGVLDVLAAARHLVTAAPTAASSATPSAGPDAVAWALVSPDGSSPVAARREAVVEVHGLGRLGAQLALHLAVAGVGTVRPVDPRPVSPVDLGTAGLAARDVGVAREAAVSRSLHDARPDVRTRVGPPPDLVVTVEHGAADPVVARAHLAAGTPQLSVVVREASVLVGPLVLPGRTACLRCLDLHRADADPGWPTVAAQLCARAGRATPEETLLAAVGAAQAAAAAVAFVDARAGLERRHLVVALPDLLPRVVEVPVHPDCGCTTPPT